jgi:hypothetical protein
MLLRGVSVRTRGLLHLEVGAHVAGEPQGELRGFLPEPGIDAGQHADRGPSLKRLSGLPALEVEAEITGYVTLMARFFVARVAEGRVEFGVG